MVPGRTTLAEGIACSGGLTAYMRGRGSRGRADPHRVRQLRRSRRHRSSIPPSATPTASEGSNAKPDPSRIQRGPDRRLPPLA